MGMNNQQLVQEISLLSNYFVYNICEAINSQEMRYNYAYFEIQELIKNGYTVNQIKHIFDAFKIKTGNGARRVFYVSEIMKAMDNEPLNLLDQETRYFHPELIEKKPAVKIVRQPNGELKKIKEPFRGIQYINHFTVNNLLEYFYKKMSIQADAHSNHRFVKRDRGRMNYLLESYSVEEILYSIDIARRFLQANNQEFTKNIFDLESYVEEGRKLRSKKKNLFQQMNIKEEI